MMERFILNIKEMEMVYRIERKKNENNDIIWKILMI